MTMVSFLNLLNLCSNNDIAVCETFQEQLIIEAEELNTSSYMDEFGHVEGVSFCIHQCENTFQDKCVAVRMDLDKNL